MMMAEGEVWVCNSCGNEQPKDESSDYTTTATQEESEVIETSGGTTGLPTTDAQCPECGNDRAYWYMQQIRAADESETRFFVCTDCEHKWREDDH